MTWPELTAKRLLVLALALYLALSLAVIQGAIIAPPTTLDDPDAAVNDAIATGNETGASAPNLAASNVTRQPSRAATNCTNVSEGPVTAVSRRPFTTNIATRGSSSQRHIPRSLVAADTRPAVGPGGNATRSLDASRHPVPTSRRITCRLIERFSPPEWVTELAASQGGATTGTADSGANVSLPSATNSSALARRQDARLALARDLRAILTDDSRSRRGATFAAAKLALSERKNLLADRPVNVSALPPQVVQRLKQRNISADEQLSVSVEPQLTAQQTKLRGSRDLLATAETDSTAGAHSLSGPTRLTETAFEVQVTRVQTDSRPLDPSDVTLPTTTTPDHDTPVAAVLAILEAHDVEVTNERVTDVQTLGTLPVATQRELTDVLDAYLGYYRAVRATDGTDVRRVRAAQLQLLEAAADLEAALADTETRERVENGSIQVPGVVSIDLSRTDTTYVEDYKLQLDVGGDDTYTNNAGGANASGKSTDVAALIDFGGRDTYRGRNGGGRYNVTKESPSPPAKQDRLFLPKKGDAAGFLLDAGTGNDTYLADAHASNGGSKRGIGFLLDAGGTETYTGNGTGTNGAGYRKGAGFLLDAGLGADTYDASGKVEGISNGGGGAGRGFLFDVGGNDTYRGSNGGGNRPIENNYLLPHGKCITVPQVRRIVDRLCQIYFVPVSMPTLPKSGGFLLDGGGADTYTGSNGGANRRASGFLLDAGTGNDTYDGKNGGANSRGSGFLLDMGGTDRYVPERSRTRNGAGRSNGMGFLMDGGVGDDTYNVRTGGGPSASQRSELAPGSLGANGGGWAWVGGHGFLVDSGGNDSYLAGDVGTNGGAARGDSDRPPALPGIKNPATGFLLDASGDDRYQAGASGVNGGASGALGLLYDNSGRDHYTDRFHRCIDCSDVPKGAVGAQIDRGSGGENASQRTGPTEVLVVDDIRGADDVDCPDAAYQAIQPAVDAADPGDTVRVCAGTYPGNVTVDTRNVRVEVTVPGQVILDGEHERRVGIALVAPRTTVTGFTATNFGTGFTVIGRATTVKNTKIINNTHGVNVAGLYSGGLSQALPGPAPASEEKQPTLIANNTVTGGKIGINVVKTGNVRVSGNTVRATQHGISVLRGSGVTIQDNTVSGHSVPTSKHQGGINLAWSLDMTVTGNRVTGFTAPDQLRGTSEFPYGTGGFGIKIRSLGGGERASHTLRNNRLADNTINLDLRSVPDNVYKHFTITPSNTVNGKPVVYLVRAVGVTIGPSGISELALNASRVPDSPLTNTRALDVGTTPGYVACINCIGVTIRDLELSHNAHGVLVVQSRGIVVTNLTIHDTARGISLIDSQTNAAVTNNTVRDTRIAINSVHNCDTRENGLRETYLELTRGTFDLCATPSVQIAHNTINDTRMGIRAAGIGVTVRENTISNARRVAIWMSGGRSLTSSRAGRAGLFGTGLQLRHESVFSSTVIDNSIASAAIGVRLRGTHQGVTVVGNTIRNAKIGLYTGANNGVTYRANLVTDTITGMYVTWREVSLTARNNTFREVRWGLDGRFLYAAAPEWAPATHDFGTTNTVNGERIIWLKSATNRTIEAAGANMVACIKCVNVTIRDMTLTDNGYGVLLWDTTSTLVTNVTATDTLRSGVVIRAGTNNTVRDSTIIDSNFPIWGYPITPGPTQLGRNGPAASLTRDTSGQVGPVRIVNNRIAVDDASWAIELPGMFTDPDWYAHYGIVLLDPTEATIIGNNVTDNKWGVFLRGDHISDIRIMDNTIRSPHTRVGFERFGGYLGPFAYTVGMSVGVASNDSANSSLVIRNNTLIKPSPKGGGIALKGRGLLPQPFSGVLPPTTVINNTIRGYKLGLNVNKRSNATTVSIRRNRFIATKSASVKVTGSAAGESVEIHQNLLDPLRFGYGVKYIKGGGGGGHMGGGGGSGGDDMTHGMQPVDARCNRWAAPSGPSSRRILVVDPMTGEPANGNGSIVSQGHMQGVSNVRFHPWLGNSPGRSCAKELVGTATPTPIPTATRTPWPTPGGGAGPGPGPGQGPGPDQNAGPGPGQATVDRGGMGTQTATARVPVTNTPTTTPPATATPEIVPGFGVSAWLVAGVLLVVVLAIRRRP